MKCSVPVVRTSAVLSEDGIYRYRLDRELHGTIINPQGEVNLDEERWYPLTPTEDFLHTCPTMEVRPSGPRLGVVMVNPSVADAEESDPTVNRLLHFAWGWRFRYLRICNEFARRSTDIKVLKEWDADRNEGPDNPLHLVELAEWADLLIIGWGPRAKLPPHLQRHWKRTINNLGRKDLYCFGTAQDGHPRHPLMVEKNVVPSIWSPQS